MVFHNMCNHFDVLIDFKCGMYFNMKVTKQYVIVKLYLIHNITL